MPISSNFGLTTLRLQKKATMILHPAQFTEITYIDSYGRTRTILIIKSYTTAKKNNKIKRVAFSL